jgi:hypothetical protein
MLNIINRDTGGITKQNAVVVWGGIKDISRNESQTFVR